MKHQLIQRCVLTSTCLFITALAPAVFGQGALTPPGAPAPTFKTLTQVEPRTDVLRLPGSPTSTYVITAPGSYYLSTNLIGFAFTNGITVLADHVTIDLRGFAIIGAGQFGGNANAIVASVPTVDLRVLNGTITSWSGEGVSAQFSKNGKLEDLITTAIGRSAFHLGDGWIVNDCLVQSNCFYAGGTPAIYAGNHCAVESSVAQNNNGPGISTANGGLVTVCVANNNLNYGIYTGDDSRVNNCVASMNMGNQVGDGIYVGYGSSVSGCVADGNAYNGIETINGGLVLGCTVRTNMNHGIVVQYGSTVKDCTASANHFNGIVITLRSHVVGNTCDANGNAGIKTGLGGDGNRIDSNSVTTNTVAGIDCSGSTADLVIRNSARLNGINYSLNAATENATIFFAGPGLLNPDPWGNFSY
ncbi:MAG: right-handed parallel beta-helix repeat-containing protein [Verrucomicrobiota bacterium]|jgi:hypothetical protein